MGPLSTVINSGYLLVMMEMPGTFNLFNTSQCICRPECSTFCWNFPLWAGWTTCGPSAYKIESMHVGRRPVQYVSVYHQMLDSSSSSHRSFVLTPLWLHLSDWSERRDSSVLLQLSCSRMQGQDVCVLWSEWSQNHQQSLSVWVQRPHVCIDSCLCSL